MKRSKRVTSRHLVSGSRQPGSAGADGCGVGEVGAGETVDVGDDGTELVEVAGGVVEGGGGSLDVGTEAVEDGGCVDVAADVVGALVDVGESGVEVVVVLEVVVVVVDGCASVVVVVLVVVVGAGSSTLQRST